MIQKVRQKVGVVQNLGWFDRVLRFLAGAGFIVVPAFWLATDPTSTTWTYYLMLGSIYPTLTGILGWDPIYCALNIKSCDTSETNQCGSFPYELDAARGNEPIPTSEYDRRLENAYHEEPYEIK